VAETVFNQKVHLTEKIFKPIVMLQPFIVFAGPGSLKYLQSYGFQTFSAIWDESYDEEVDSSTRLEKIINGYKKSNDHIALSNIEHHYFSNGGFFGNDNYLLEKENLDKIKHIPTTIVQGRYDVLCPAISAYHLHEKLPKAKFYLTIAGHSGYDEGNADKLVEATNIYKKGYKH
jgi:pimeloyl-ACP methyl ester carboxylesterase